MIQVFPASLLEPQDYFYMCEMRGAGIASTALMSEQDVSRWMRVGGSMLKPR